MKKIKVKPGQNLMDIAIREMGHVEGLGELVRLNNLPLTAKLEPGQELFIPGTHIDHNTVKHYRQNDIHPATGQESSESIEDLLQGGIGFMEVKTSFKVS